MAINSVTKVELFDYDGDLKKGWYVGFKYVHPHSGKTIYAQVRGQINYYKTKSERREHGGYLVTLVKEALSQGWEPYKETVYDFLVNATEQKEPGLNFKSALDLALSKGFWSSKTKRDYSCAARLFTSACSALGMIEKPIDEFSRKDIISMGDWLLKNRDSWSPKAYNKNMCYLKALFSILEDREIIKDNPVRRIKNMAVTESRKYEPYTKEEKKAILELLEKDKHFAEKPDGILVLNSLSFLNKSQDLILSFDQIDLYLDDDMAGKKATEQALSWSKKIRDHSHFYEGFKDLNTYLVAQNLQCKEQEEPKISYGLRR